MSRAERRATARQHMLPEATANDDVAAISPPAQQRCYNELIESVMDVSGPGPVHLPCRPAEKRWLMTLPGWIRHRRLSLKVVVAILLASSLVTLVVTSIQLYVEYRRDLNTLEQTLTDARGSFAGPLGASLWALDEDQLQLQLQGLESLPHVKQAELSGDAELTVGETDDYPHTHQMTIPVRYRTSDGVHHQLGTVEVTASLAGIHARVWERLLTILGTQAAKTFVVSLLLLALIYYLVIRHLQYLARFARALRLDHLEDSVELPRGPGGLLRPDELDELAGSLNYATTRMAEDMDARLHAERRHRLLSGALQQSPAGVMILDDRSRLEYANPRFEAFSGCALAEHAGRPVFGDNGWLEQHLTVADGQPDPWEIAREGGEWRGEIRFRRADGQYRWAHAAISAINAGQGSQYIAVFEDLTQLRTVEKRLDYQTHFDPLTGLPNRQLMQQLLAAAIGPQGEHAGAVVLLDINNFKAINESLGPDGGDQVLRAIADHLRHLTDPGWQAGRFGNDEFILVIPGAWSADALFERICEFLEQLREVRFVNDQPFVLAFTAGVAPCPGSGRQVPELLRAADAALSRAKHNPLTPVCMADYQHQDDTRRRLTLDADLHRALAEGEFLLHYQPIIDLADGHITGLEALIRWDHPTRGLIPPDEFINLAEDNGLILPMGEWVLRASLATLAALRRDKDHASLRMAVNVSPRQLGDTAFADTITRALAEHDLPSWALTLEITERVFMEDVALACQTLHRLQEMGVNIAIDDFGKGYSSLSYLQRLQADVLKVDRGFVRSLSDNAGNRELVRTIVAIAHGFGLKTVAEGVETAADLDVLRELGCECAQGYFFYRPMPLARLQDVLGTRIDHAL